MGASVSKNIASIITNSISKISSEIIQRTQLTTDSSQIISVSDIQGDVNISGNTFSQKASINMTALFDALTQEENQQKILLDVVQNAKSLIKDINLVQYSNSNDTLNTIVNATSNILSNINQNCKIFLTQNQEIIVERVVGNLNITNNVQDQINNLFQDCNERAVSENKILQDLSASLNQTASSTTAGLSPWALAGIIAAALGIPIVGAAVALPRLLKFIFPILILVGIIFLILYNVQTREEMIMTAYSDLLQTNCQVQLLKEINDVTAINAANVCKADSNCKGFDWKLFDNTGTAGQVVARLYSNIEPSNCQVKQDTLNPLRIPNLDQGKIIPTLQNTIGNEGDVFLNQNNGVWYQRTNKWPTGWQPMGQFINDPFTTISWGFNDPAGLVQNEGDEPIIFPEDTVFVKVTRFIDNYIVYRFKNKRWNEQRRIKGPGINHSISSESNTSGIKTIVKPTWMLYSGLASLITGVVGFFIYNAMNQSDNISNTYSAQRAYRVPNRVPKF